MKNKETSLALINEASSIEQAFATISVTNDSSLAQASDVIKQAKDLAKRLKTEKEIETKEANEVIRAAKAKYDPVIKRLGEIETSFKKASEMYMLEKMKVQEEQQAKVAARVERGTMKESTAMRKLDVIGTDANKARTENSGLRIIMRKDVEPEIVEYTAEDLHKLYVAGYLKFDLTLVRKDVLAGVEVKGFRIVEKPVTQSV